MPSQTILEKNQWGASKSELFPLLPSLDRRCG